MTVGSAFTTTVVVESIKRARKAAGMSLTQVAARSGVTAARNTNIATSRDAEERTILSAPAELLNVKRRIVRRMIYVSLPGIDLGTSGRRGRDVGHKWALFVIRYSLSDVRLTLTNNE